MDQFEYILTVPVVKHCFFVLPVAIKIVDLSIYVVYGNQFVDRFRKNNESVKKWGTSDFSWGLVTFQGYSSPWPVENLA